MSRLSHAREPRGARRRARVTQKNKLLDALLGAVTDPRVSLPTPVRGFAPVQAWLAQQPRLIMDAATSLMRDLADAHPELLLARTQRNEIGACSFARAAVHHDLMINDVDTFTRTFGPSRAAPTPPSPAKARGRYCPADTSGRNGVLALLHHLFARYPTPAWIDWSMLLPGMSLAPRGTSDVAPPALLAHVGQGRSMRTAPLPVPMTHALAHALSNTGIHGPRLAIRTAQCVVSGIDAERTRHLASALAQPAFFRPDEEACLARYLAFVAQTTCDAGELAIVTAWVLDLIVREPSFSFAHRTHASVLARAMDDLRREVRSARRFRLFPASGIAVGRFESADGPFIVNEIDNGAELALEAQRRRHCAATYANAILSGRCALFAVEREGDPARGVTVEVHLRDRRVGQIKGFANRAPDAIELDVVRAWSTRAGLAH